MQEEVALSKTCDICGTIKTYSNKCNYERGIQTSYCQACAMAKVNRSKNVSKENNPAWKGYKGVGYNWFSKYFERGKKKRTGTITIQDCYNKLESQGFRCALSGVPLAWAEESGMSIDRIDSSKEYVLDNIQLVHKDVNLMKNHFDEDYFVETCARIAAERFWPDLTFPPINLWNVWPRSNS